MLIVTPFTSPAYRKIAIPTNFFEHRVLLNAFDSLASYVKLLVSGLGRVSLWCPFTHSGYVPSSLFVKLVPFFVKSLHGLRSGLGLLLSNWTSNTGRIDK